MKKAICSIDKVRPSSPVFDRATSSAVRMLWPALILLMLADISHGQARSVVVSGLAPPILTTQGTEDNGGHKFTLTYGFNQTFRPRNDDTGATLLRGPFSFSVEVAPWLTLIIGNDTFKSAKPKAATRITGAGDTSLTAISTLIPEEICADTAAGQDCKQHPSFTLVYYAKFPTASTSKGLGSGEVDHLVLGAIGKTFGRNYIEADFGAYFAGRSDHSGFVNIGLLNLVYERALDASGKWNFHTEVDGSAPTEFASEVYALNWLVYKATDHVSFKVGTQHGLTVNSPKFGVYGSITVNGIFR